MSEKRSAPASQFERSCRPPIISPSATQGTALQLSAGSGGARQVVFVVSSLPAGEVQDVAGAVIAPVSQALAGA